MFKKLWSFHSLYLVLLCFIAIQTVVFYFFSKIAFTVFLVLFVIISAFTCFRIIRSNKKISSIVKSINEDLDATSANALSSFNLPVLIVSEQMEIVWYNKKFSDGVLNDADSLIGQNLEDFIGTSGIESLNKTHNATVIYASKIFDVFETLYLIDKSELRILCFVDQTDLRKTASEHKLSRPVVAFAAVDNLEDIARNMRDSERYNASSRIQNTLEDWFSVSSGIFRRISSERYSMIFEERDLITFISNKFDILNRVRDIDFQDKGRATVSIGIGRGKTMRECEEQAAQALDMALGRGGDQVAVKNLDNSFQFFGGKTGANEKRTRVRTRIVASALTELIENSPQIILMGHKFADLDCFGSAYALCSAIRKKTGKKAVIAIDDETAMIKPLLSRLRDLGADTMTASKDEIVQNIKSDALIIVLDTNRKCLVEYPELLNLSGKITVIDHHRKSVDYIDNAVIFYHETAASSTSEMVSELLLYVGENYVGKPEAEAMLSGIMLDTRDFCINTGVRTFEASAFLRRRGAEPVAVKKMFSDSIEDYKYKNSVVSTAIQYKNIAIAFNKNNEKSLENKKLISSESANELLKISGVKASFVLFEMNGKINISARSYGEVNVQLIMESFGGGGHSTMAACQLEESDFETAKNMLISAIEKNEEG